MAITRERLLQMMERQEQEGCTVYLDIETYRGEEADLAKEIAWHLRKDHEKLEGLKSQTEQARKELEEYREKCKVEGKKVFKKDTASWDKILDGCGKLATTIEEKERDFREMAALKNSARILCVSVVCPQGKYVFHTLPVDENEAATLINAGIKPVQAEDEKQMLELLFALLDSMEPIARLVTWNGSFRGGFDLSKLRLRAGQKGVTKAQCLKIDTETRHVDLMYVFSHYYLTEDASFCRLPKACDFLGLDTSKIGDGSEVAGLYESGDWVTLLAYCVNDSLTVKKIDGVIFD